MDRAGKAVGVSGKSMQRYRKLKETATPEVLAALESGEMSLGEASRATQGKRPEPSRKELLKKFDAVIGQALRVGNKIGFKDATGRKMYELLDRICKLIEGWK